MAMTGERVRGSDERIDEATMRELRDQLQRSRDRLLAELRRENQERKNADNYGDLVNAVPDPGDASVATEQADLRHAQIGRDVAELRQIDAALARFEEGTYGICSNCGLDIAPARLQASPAAERCIVCQSAFEKQYADPGAPAITRKV